MKRIRIIERKSGRPVATIKDYEDEAWKCVVDDSSVDPIRRDDDYTFNIVDTRARTQGVSRLLQSLASG